MKTITSKTSQNFSLAEFAPLEKKKAELLEVVARSKDIKIEDIEDIAQIKAVRRARLNLKNIRIDTAKKGKAMREEATNFSKNVIKIEKELIGLILPEEQRLQEEETRAELELENKRRLLLLPDRLTKLKSIFYEYSVAKIKFYNFENEKELWKSKILSKNDEEFKKFIEEIEFKLKEEEFARKQEEELKKQIAENNRIEEEKLKIRTEKLKIEEERNKIEQNQAKLEEKKESCVVKFFKKSKNDTNSILQDCNKDKEFEKWLNEKGYKENDPNFRLERDQQQAKLWVIVDRFKF